MTPALRAVEPQQKGPSSLTLQEILDALTAWIRKYTVLPTIHDAPTLALWIVMTWVSGSFFTTPRIVLSSPVPGSGKTRVLELLALVCWDARMTINSSVAALFRRIGIAHRNEETPPTILFDEIDSVFGNSRPSESTEQLRGLMNAGYKRGATIDRCEGDAAEMKVIEWPIFAPLALAGLGSKLPDTITTRSIVIEMRKRAPNESIAPFRERKAEAEIRAVVEALRDWGPGAAPHLEGAEPVLPDGVEDRPAEVWEPLIAIADLAGGHWPGTAREACQHFVFTPKPKTPSLGVELLADIRTVMGHGSDSTYQQVDRIPTKVLISYLIQLDESPWRDLGYGKALDARRLSQILSGYQVAPVTFKRDDGSTAKGYMIQGNEKQVGLADAWLRYLPTPPAKTVTPVTTVTPQVNGVEKVTQAVTVTDIPHAGYRTPSVTETQKVTENISSTSEVTPVTEVTDFAERGGGDTAVNDAIFNATSTDTPMGIGAIMRQVRDATGNGASVPDALDALAAKDLIRETSPGKWVRTNNWTKKEDAA